MGVHDKQALPYNGHSNYNLYYLVEKTTTPQIDLLFVLNIPIEHILICEAENHHLKL